MSNPEHLAVLKRGLKAWNQWRINSPSKPDLSGVDLGEADLREVHLWKVNFRGADLFKADLSEVNLEAADLSEVDLRGANLSKAYLFRANLNAARLGATILADIDLSSVVGLESVRHELPSSIGIDTLFRSAGAIPEIFLRGTGVPEQFITYAKSLVGTGIGFYSCFISYSGRDQAFADRLHTDLQANGVRCWFAAHDVQGGRKLHETVSYPPMDATYTSPQVVPGRL